MMEIERKILDISPSALIKKIQKLSPKPKKLFEGLVRVEYFDFPDSKIRGAKDLLRLREFIPIKGAKSGSKNAEPYTEFVYKIYKGVKNGCKYFDEAEIKIPGMVMKTFGEILMRMGLKQTLFYEKKRTLFDYGKAKFEIDEHPMIDPFVEIEAANPAIINEMIPKLGLENNEQTSESISELLRRKYPKISLNGLVFKRKK